MTQTQLICNKENSKKDSNQMKTEQHSQKGT